MVAYGVLYDWIFRRFRPYRALLREIREFAWRSLELERAFGRLRPGGHAIVVNFARRAPVVATARAVWAREGLGTALHALLWLVPSFTPKRLAVPATE